MMSVKDLVKSLDEADLFLRNRADASQTNLNEYDVDIMKAIAKICDAAARSLEAFAETTNLAIGSTVYYPVKGTSVILKTPVYGLGVGQDNQMIINPKEYSEDVIEIRGAVINSNVFLDEQSARNALSDKTESTKCS